MANPVLIAKGAAIVLTDEKLRKAAGWILVAILSPLILLIAFLCSLGSGASGHNASAVEVCFNGAAIPVSAPAEYRTCLENMRSGLALVDTAVSTINAQTEEGKSLDAVRVKAIFYVLYFGAESYGDAQTFADCFVTYEERTRMVPVEGSGPPAQTEEKYTVAVPITDMEAVWQNIASAMGVTPTAEQRANADSIYSLVKYGWAGSGTGGVWSGGDIGEPVLSVDGFCSPLGSGWQSRVTSEFGWRNCPYHGRELHSGLDMAAPTGTPIRAALSGTVTKSCRTNSYGNYTVIDHGNGMTTAYAHQSERLVKVGDTVSVGQVIGLVGSTGNSTGPHLHLEVRVNGSLVNPRSYLP